MGIQSTRAGLDAENFRHDIDGKKTDLFVLKNSKGMELAVTSYGARAVQILAADRSGKFGDVITGI